VGGVEGVEVRVDAHAAGTADPGDHNDVIVIERKLILVDRRVYIESRT